MTVPESTKTISLAEFRKLLAEPLASNPGCGTRCDYQSPYFWVYYCGVGCRTTTGAPTTR